MHLSWWIILMGQNDKKGTVSPKQGQLVPMTRIHCCLVESAIQQGWNNSTERSVNAPHSPQLRANMKSNYECFVLTASCLIISLPSRPGKVCFDFLDSYTAWCHAASCAKPRPTNNCPYQRLLILFLFLGNGSWDEISTWGPHVSQRQNFSLAAVCRSRQQLSRTFTGCTCTEGLVLLPMAALTLLPGRATGVTGWRCRHRPHWLNHLPGFKAWQVGLEDFGD